MRTPSTGNAAPPDDDVRKASQSGEARKAKTGKALATRQPSVDGRPAPRLPHERDESADSGAGAGAPSELMHRAHDDVVGGKQGTDKGEATDAVYRRTLRGRTPGAERD